MRAFIPKGWSRPVLTSDATGEGLKDWEHAVRTVALLERQALGWIILDEPVTVYLHFFLPRPKSLPKRVTRPVKKPDLDKLVRAVFDALTKVIWRDDAVVVKLITTKNFATPEGIPGVAIEVCRGEE